jgi:hypothetical protein
MRASQTLFASLALLAVALPAAAQTSERVSLSTAGAEGDHTSYSPRISADGRHVVFETRAGNLFPGDGNANRDILLRDRETDTTIPMSENELGVQGNAGNHAPDLSDDGRYVVFYAYSSNLGSLGDTTGVADVFLRDRDTDEDGIYDEVGEISLEQVSVDLLGGQPDGGSMTCRISGDGSFVAFDSFADDMTVVGGHSPAVIARDLVGGSNIMISIDRFGAAASGFISDVDETGDSVMFWSNDADLVTGDTNGRADVFVRSVGSATTLRVSVSTLGVEGNDDSYRGALSDDGRYVAFFSEATNLIDGETTGVGNVFVRDRDPDGNGTFDEGNATTTLVSVNSYGVEGLGAMEPTYGPSISGDGRYVAFNDGDSSGDCCDMVWQDDNGEFDIFLHDRTTGITTRMSVDEEGQGIGGKSWGPDLDEDGDVVVFSTWAALDSADSNTHEDIYVRDQSLWRDLSWGMVGSPAPQPGPFIDSVPKFTCTGELTDGSAGNAKLVMAKKGATSHLILGFTELSAPLKGGVLVPSPDILITPLTVSSPAKPFGGWDLPFTWPSGIGSGFAFYLQVWIEDSAGPKGVVSSNGIRGVTP